ncbi:uncharacterized protein PFL1_03457 [Pseudozyma flocculosa PF-1]|uniref:Related to KAP114 - Member of the karyopherin-beta family, nuclear import n=2 Tax=Pseudozyma flocculosa TaxID=84751 RepID=A0A5C3FDJ3_9BASI|nr:uncharacterized protein PFL1_03457 [Pseudozyma flocculosa PF-1]EPQ29170.1 hypothetical protein PFL1_03457 [Pseudozyma flocculosa PF-1]SPO41531.1 related to KAP114 - Member of the karyopherin-beta family, nuclear import [Pseudozyma flocculosa]
MAEHQLAALLEATLSPDNATRSEAERELSAIQGPDSDAQGNVGLALVNLLLDASLALHLRQSAGIALRKFITRRWSPYFDPFAGSPAVDAAVKDQIRQRLLQGLADPQRKVRLATSYAISTIAGPDYPDQYPQLLPCLQHLLQQDDPHAIHGAMTLLCDFVKVEMDEVQLMQVAREVLPTLEELLADEQRHTPHIRARCILVFRQCLTTLFMVRESFPDVAKQASNELLPRWLSAMESLLAKDAAAELQSGGERGWETLSLRNEIFKTLKVAAMFRSQFKSHVDGLIRLSLANLSSLLPVFTRVYLSSSSDVTPPAGEEGDDDVAADLPSLACSILDFIAEASRGDRCRAVFLSGGTGGDGAETEALSQLVALLLVYVDMTTDDEDNWANDANAFIADEDDETLAYSLRIATADLLGTLIEDYPGPALRCLGREVERRVQQGSASKARGEEEWWKAPEGVLTAIGNNAEAITEILDAQSASGQSNLDVEAIFTNVVLPNVGADAPPFLQGRGFVFASQFASTLPQELAVQFLEAAVNAIDSDAASLPVKISAVRTIKNFFRHLPSRTVAPFAGRIVRQLGPLLTQASEDTLVLVVETIQSVVVEDEEAAHTAEGPLPPIVEPQVIGSIVQAALQIWAPNARDVILLSVVSDLLESLAGSRQQGVPDVVVQSSMPLLAAAIGSGIEQQDNEPSALAETAVELAKSVLDGAESAALRGVVAILCPNLLKVLKVSEDRDVQQNGIECLTLLVRKCGPELLAWREPAAASAPSAVESILEVVARQLAPTDSSESGGLAIGDLVIALLRKAGDQIGPVLPQLVDAMVRRLATAQTGTFCQSLIVPIAFLMHRDDAQAKQVMDLLEGIAIAPSTGGGGGADEASSAAASGSGLEVLLRKWVENADTLQGFWQQRISAMALCKVVGSGRRLLGEVVVRGDLIPDTSNVIRTRSRAKTMPHQYTQVPLLAKMVKLLIKDWTQATRGPPDASAAGGLGEAAGARTPETDDEDGEWDDDDADDIHGGAGAGAKSRNKDLAFLSDMLGPGGLEALNADGGDGDDDFWSLNPSERDPDILNDAVYSMDFKAFLEEFFLGLSQSRGEDLQRVYSLLNDEEQKWVRMAVEAAGRRQ